MRVVCEMDGAVGEVRRRNRRFGQERGPHDWIVTRTCGLIGRRISGGLLAEHQGQRHRLNIITNINAFSRAFDLVADSQVISLYHQKFVNVMCRAMTVANLSHQATARPMGEID